MKVAVASGDGISIAEHFGRSSCFIVFHIVDQKIVSEEVRQNTVTAHAKGECSGGEHQPHDHDDVVRSLGDCNTVLCRGMGWRAAEAFVCNGVSPFVVEEEMSPRQAAEKYLGGALQAAGSFCRCSGK